MTASYTLLYHAGIPGRGEYVRLAFEAAQVAFTDTNKDLYTLTGVNGNAGHPAHLACPLLKIELDGSATPVYLSQTPAILAYLAPRLGLDGTKDDADLGSEHADIRRAHVSQLTATILDLSNEIHDTHHPISVGAYYEDQKEAAARRAEDLRKNRIPKFFRIFDRSIAQNPAQSGFLIGKHATVADLVLFQVVDGIAFAFPNLTKSLRESGEYKGVYALRDQVAALPGIKAYLDSGRRASFSNGIFRHYPELDPETSA